MATQTDSLTDLADEDLEPVADETAHQARKVVAAYASDAEECRVLLFMLGIFPDAKDL